MKHLITPNKLTKGVGIHVLDGGAVPWISDFSRPITIDLYHCDNGWRLEVRG